jgi:hypothetical protein
VTEVFEKMAALGYHHDGRFGLETVSFVKTYASDEDRIVQVRVFFDKPVTGLEGLLLSSISTVEQSVFAPQDVQRRAPEVAHKDLTKIIATFSLERPQRSIDVRKCALCAATVTDYYIVNDDTICVACAK